jgi:iron(III) transport system ATP-binding protein
MDIPFASRIQVSEESTFTEDLGTGDKVKLTINIKKINVFNEDGSRNLLEEES